MPTLADLAGVEAPSNDGISFLPALLQEDQARHESLYWEFHNVRGSHSQAVRFFDSQNTSWKAVRIYNERTGLNPEIELFDLDSDPYETTNVSETYPELIMRAKQIMAQSRRVLLLMRGILIFCLCRSVICNNKQSGQVIDGLNVLAESRDFRYFGSLS